MNYKKECGIYIHIPFCRQRCLYCDYSSNINYSLQDEYFEALRKEIIRYSVYSDEYTIKTIYIGGGTPSSVNEKYISDTLGTLFKYFSGTPEEFTIEVNPESVTDEKIKFYKSLGVNRISMGVQSSDAELLKKVGRVHTADTAEEKFNLIQKYIPNINLDFILGFPFETEEIVQKNLDFIKRLSPEHLSYYIYDDSHDVPLKKYSKYLPDDDYIDTQLNHIYESLKEMNYERYEISAWCKNKRSLHNSNYWLNGNYFGFGLSAGGHFEKIRYVNTWEIVKYLRNSNFISDSYEYYRNNPDKVEIIETFFMVLRLLNGINYDIIANRFNDELIKTSIQFIKTKMDKYITIDNSKNLKFTEYGLNFSREAFEKLLELEEILWI